MISTIKCKLVHLAVRNTTPLDRWRNRVSIILEKSAENVNMAKLRAILLLKVNFNALNKIVFNGRAILSIKASKTIPYKVIGEKRGQSLVYMALNKKLVYDIENQLNSPTVVVSADATNYYDRIAHSISSISCQYFGL